jgi:anti-anti-sigma factor
MPVTLSTIGPATVIAIEGRLKFGPDLDAFRARWSDALSSGARNIVLDLSAVPAMDSSGIGCLVRCHCSAQAVGAKVRLAGAGGNVGELLRVVRLDRVLESFPDRAAALAASGSS